MRFSLRRERASDDPIFDRLTGAYTRRHLDDVIVTGVDDDTTSTMIVSIDDFDSYDGVDGRPTGEQVLERVAWRIMASARATDIVCRDGASSFCVLLPGTTETEAAVLADRVRANVDIMPPLASTCGVAVTIGVSTGSSTELADTLSRAERACASHEVSSMAPPATSAVRDELEGIFAAASDRGEGAPPTPQPVSMLPPASTPFAPPVV